MLWQENVQRLTFNRQRATVPVSVCLLMRGWKGSGGDYGVRAAPRIITLFS